MNNFNFIVYFFSFLLITNFNVLANESTEQRELKNKIHNFSSKNIDTDMSTKWSLTGLNLEKYDDNYTFIKNPKLKIFNSNFSDRAFTTDTPTPCRPPETLYES